MRRWVTAAGGTGDRQSRTLCAPHHRTHRAASPVIAAGTVSADHPRSVKCPGETIEPVLGSAAGRSQSLVVLARVTRTSSFVVRQSRQRHPVVLSLGNRHFVREIGAPIPVPEIAGHGRVAL